MQYFILCKGFHETHFIIARFIFMVNIKVFSSFIIFRLFGKRKQGRPCSAFQLNRDGPAIHPARLSASG